jgi:hypothetical protein
MIGMRLLLRGVVLEGPISDNGVASGGAACIPCHGSDLARPLSVIGADGLAGNPEHLANFRGLRSRIAGGFVEIEPQDKFGHGRISKLAGAGRRCPNLIS